MPANPERGEVDLVVGGSVLTLSLTTNDLCSLQAKTGKTYGEMLAAFAKFDFVIMRELLFASLGRYHRKQFPTIESVGLLMDACGGALELTDTFRSLADVNRRIGPLKGGEKNPPTAESIGSNSTLTPVESA